GTRSQQRAAMQKSLNGARSESNRLRTQLSSYKAENEQQEAALADLKKRQERLAGEIATTNSGKGMTEEEKIIEAERLRREIERLANDTAALSAL
ncbi:synembryn, partial [Desulfovibrio sp. OttesenSCG-928-I05]|nr:synembryn [Desulfovibrio sp. OttesenSCG-928-I05]